MAVHEFLQARWPGYRDHLDRLLSGAIEQVVIDVPTWFEWDLPAQLDWTFDEAEARRITQPVLSVLGGDRDALWPRFGETHRLLLEWLPHGEGFILPGTTHFLQMEAPHGMAEGLSDCLRRDFLKT